jgi:hypothetical protein
MEYIPFKYNYVTCNIILSTSQNTEGQDIKRMVLPVVLHRYEICYPILRGKTHTIQMLENKGKIRQGKVKLSHFLTKHLMKKALEGDDVKLQGFSTLVQVGVILSA